MGELRHQLDFACESFLLFCELFWITPSGSGWGKSLPSYIPSVLLDDLDFGKSSFGEILFGFAI